MDVWMSELPMQATEIAHPYIPTRTDAVSESGEIPMYVYFPSAWLEETGYGLTGNLKKQSFSYNPNYIHTKTII